MTKHVTAAAVWHETLGAKGDEPRLHLVDPVVTNALIRRMLKPGLGEEFVVLIMRPEDAWKHSDVKFLFGHLYEPVVKYGETGYTKNELHLVAKAQDGAMPEGKTSLTELNREEMREYIDFTKRFLHEEFPREMEAHRRECLTCQEAA